MKVQLERIQKQNEFEYVSGPVLYWMDRDMRLEDNWALLRAQEIALENNTEFIICYNLDPQFLGGTIRQLDFKVTALRELHKDSHKLNIAFYTLVDFDSSCILDFIKEHKIGYVITDFSPLRIQRKWLSTVVKSLNIPIEVVDTHNVVPIWSASDKKEFAAYTIRPKIQKKLKEFLIDFPKLKKQNTRKTNFQKIDFDLILEKTKTDKTVKLVKWCTAGEESANRALKHFIAHSEDYSKNRNNPVVDVQSQLSPYLHYGMIAPQRVAYEVMNSDMNHESKRDFLEELIIRRELADNFCYYEPNYDTSEGFHEYFKEELKKNEKIKRDYLYTKKEFEEARTHDDLWNACQMQMVKTGKMHGYLRMYWAKMIYAWTKDVNEAMKIAIYLNDKYELDGRDPNGYTGIAWCIGGVHDRPWYVTNKVFGKLRYMSRSGMDKKFDTKAYIEKWTQNTLL